MLVHMILILNYVIWCNALSCGLEVLHDCPASLGNIILLILVLHDYLASMKSHQRVTEKFDPPGSNNLYVWHLN